MSGTARRRRRSRQRGRAPARRATLSAARRSIRHPGQVRIKFFPPVRVRSVAKLQTGRPAWRFPPTPSPASAECRRSEEHTSELQSLMRISYAVFCLKKKNKETSNIYTATNKHRHKINNKYN